MNTAFAGGIPAQMPQDFTAGDSILCCRAARRRAQYSPDGMMPQGAPESVLKVLSSFSPMAGQRPRPEQNLPTGVRDQGKRNALSSSFPMCKCTSWMRLLAAGRNPYSFMVMDIRARSQSLAPRMTGINLIGA